MLVLTLDTDWTPSYMLDYVLEMVEDAGVRSTVFCTGAYDIGFRKGVEPAIHPNFMADSTQGEDVVDVLNNLRRDIPEAVGCRTHRMYWENGLYSALKGQGIDYDSTLPMYFQPHLAPFKSLGLVRFPVWWGDGVHMRGGYSLKRFAPPGLDMPGLKVCLFHPTSIYFNATSIEHAKDLFSKSALTGEQVPPIVDGYGVRTLFQDFLNRIVSLQDTTHTLGDLMLRMREKA